MMVNLDEKRLEETIKGLEKMLSSASDRKDSAAESVLAEAVDYLTELGVLGFGRLPEEEPLRGLLTGQYFEHPDGEGLCIVKEDHMQAGGVAFVIVEGDRAGEEGYADKQEQLDQLVKVVDTKIVRR